MNRSRWDYNSAAVHLATEPTSAKRFTLTITTGGCLVPGDALFQRFLNRVNGIGSVVGWIV